MYWRALQELVNGPLNVANSGPLMDAKYNTFVANGLSVENPTSAIKPWLTSARSSITSQLAAANASSFSVNPAVSLNGNLGYITGLAPVSIKTILVNGAAYPVTWTSVTAFQLAVPLLPGTNALSIVGIDRFGHAVAGASNFVAVTYTGIQPSPIGQLVLNEIMCNPSVPGADYLELFNSSSAAFDLSGWQISELSYTFPSGSIIRPGAFLVLSSNRAAYAAAYGATVPLFDTLPGTLDPHGGLLTLLYAPGSFGSSVISRVRYASSAPWPVVGAQSGISQQLVDPRQDNWRAGNWAMGPINSVPLATRTPGAANSVAATLPVFPALWINEVQSDNITGITNRAGQHAPWIELFNPTTNTVPLAGLYLANSYSNLTAWGFPADAVMNPGEFKVVFADGQVDLSSTNELHTSFLLASGSGGVALSRLYQGLPQVLDYLDYTNLPPDHSYGSVPDGQSFFRQDFTIATPGATNNPVNSPSFVAYTTVGSIYTQDFDSLPNPGLTSVNAANPVTIHGTTYSLANPLDFAFPVSSPGPGGLGIAQMAGWYGSAAVGERFGATFGNQTTGGQLSFGLPGSPDRALGLLATTSTGATAFGARFINQTTATLRYLNVQVTGELWRQSDLPKTLECYYATDPSGTASFPASPTALLPGLNVSFPAVSSAVGGVAVDGTAPANQTNLTISAQPIADWAPGAALWLVWRIADTTGKAQGLAIDDFSFSASSDAPDTDLIFMNVTRTGNRLSFSWLSLSGQDYQLEYKDDLAASTWTPLGPPTPSTGGLITLTDDTNTSIQRFYRLRIQH